LATIDDGQTEVGPVWSQGCDVWSGVNVLGGASVKDEVPHKPVSAQLLTTYLHFDV